MQRAVRLVSIIAIISACSGGATEPAVNSNTGGTGGTGGTGVTPTQTSSVNVDDNQFSPANAQVAVGTTVTWTWIGSNQHDVTFTSGASSPTQTSGTFSRAFPTAGTFTYHCTVHGASMSGSVVVK